MSTKFYNNLKIIILLTFWRIKLSTFNKRSLLEAIPDKERKPIVKKK